MERTNLTNLDARNVLDRAARELTDRRRFLTGAGRCGVLMMAAACMPGGSTVETAAASQLTAAEDFAVEEKGFIRVLGVVQRRPGLTRMQAKYRSPERNLSEEDRAYVPGAADSAIVRPRPTSTGAYYHWVYTQLTKREPGKQGNYFHNVVTDGAFGVDGQTCAAFGNRDLVTELSYQREGQKPAVVTGRPDPIPPDNLEAGTALNLAVQQVLAHGTRPMDASGGAKAMHFIKLSPTAAARDPMKTWQTLHARATEADAAFGGGLRGYEVLQRLPDTAARRRTPCGGEIPVPELAACFWPKTAAGAPFQTAFENYVRAFRQADKENALDHAASFFLLVEEYQYTLT